MNYLKNTTLPLLFSLFLFAFVSTELHSTHLIGGSLSYEYLGQNVDGTYRYRVFGTTYIDCGPTSNVPIPEDELPIGVYENDLNDPDADKNLVFQFNLPLISFQAIQPDLPSSCTVAADVCVNEGYYETEINVPLNFGGYWLYYDRCCRNDATVNLEAQQGVGFTTYMSSPLVVNSSPFFNAPPTPYICAGDTATFLNTAIDPDGDLLVFSFITPYIGYGSAMIPNPGTFGYEDPMSWPVPSADYAPGYNENSPFGAGGYAFINGSTGLTEYSSPNGGQFSIAVEIKEYRNGNLIGITRRDLQLLVINCPPNPPPNLSVLGGGQTIFEVNEGEELCFPVAFTDLNGDSLFLSASGEVFDGGIVDPVATIETPVEGLGNVEAEFCWSTACDQGRDNPYFFSATAFDNGCPPKSANIVYTIDVIPFTGATAMEGTPNACEFSTETYSIEAISNGDYLWTVDGGTISSGQGSNEIEVEWEGAGTGMVTVISTNEIGCVGDPFDLEVAILPLPIIDAGPDLTLCAGDTVTAGGSPTGPNSSFFIWSPSVSIVDPSDSNPEIFPTESGTFIVTVVSGSNCSARDSIEVTVNEANLNVSEPVDICVGSNTELTASGGVSYTWTPALGLDDPSSDNPTANPTSTTNYIVHMTDGNSCEATDSVLVTVFEVPVADAGVDSTFCGLEIELFAQTSVGDGLWSFPPELGLDNETLSDALATSSIEGTYTLTWTEVNGDICSDSDEVELTFIEQPSADAGLDQTICGLSVPMAASASVGDGFWVLPTGISSDMLESPAADVESTSFGTFELIWTEDNNGCTSEDTVQVTFNEEPLIDAGLGGSICGDSFELSANSSVGIGTWTGPTEISFDDSNAPDAIASSSEYGEFTLTWTEDNLGCIDQSQVTVTFIEQPVADAGENIEVCGLEIVTASMPSVGSGLWTLDAGLTTADNLSQAIITVTAPDFGVYTLNWAEDNDGCTSDDDVLVEFLETPIPDAGIDQDICIFSSAQLNATGGDSYIWSPSSGLNDVNSSSPEASPEVTTTYTVQVSMDNGCSGEDELTITVNDLPSISAGEDVDYLCQGDSVQLNASAGLETYSWSPSTGLSSTSIPNPMAAPDTALVITYTVTVTDTAGCSNSDQMVLTVNPIVPTFAGNDTTICAGQPVTLGGSPTSPPGSTFIWTPDTDISDVNSANPIVSPELTTSYTVSSANSICTGQSVVTVNVEAIPELPFEIQATPSCENLIIQFRNQGSSDLEYAWDFGDGGASAEYSPTHEFGFGGAYVVTVSGESELGCIYQSDSLISAEDFSAYFPVTMTNVMTPNGDGENDVLDTGLRGAIADCIEMEVFNRWGQIVFRSTGSNTLWDGRTPAGELVNPGVYFYYIALRGTEYKGSVQVIY